MTNGPDGWMFKVFILTFLMMVAFPLCPHLSSGNPHHDDGSTNEVTRFAGGDGSSGNPYLISDVFQLQGMMDDVGAHYALANDIDASETKEWNGGSGFDPVGDPPTNGFIGSLDGRNNTITNLTVNRRGGYVGLFGKVAAGGKIANVVLADVAMDGEDHMGGLVGSLWNGFVTNCDADGRLSGQGDVGGLVGYSSSSIIDRCRSNVTISGDTYVGGLVGINDGGTVANCSAASTIDGEKFIGGLVGSNTGLVVNCRAHTQTSGDDCKIGGLAGYNGMSRDHVGAIRYSDSSGTVSGPRRVGGLVGFNWQGFLTCCHSDAQVTGESLLGGLVGFISGGDTVESCSATGDVSGYDHVGGLLGYAIGGSITNCYSTGDVTGRDQYAGGLIGLNDRGNVANCYSIGKVAGGGDVGGLVGLTIDRTVESSFWDLQTSGTGISSGGSGENTTEMKSKKTFTDAGWDFDDVWLIVDGGSYPFLRGTHAGPRMVYDGNYTHPIEEDALLEIRFDATVSSIPGYSNFVRYHDDCAWLTIDQFGVLLGRPTNEHVGTWRVNVTIEDRASMTDSVMIKIIVLNVNDRPEITSEDVLTAFSNTDYYSNYEGHDPDPTDDEMTWGLSTNSSFLSIDGRTGELTGAPTHDDVGEWWVNITLSDGLGGQDSRLFILTVFYKNTDPVINTTSVPVAIEEEPYRVILDGFDIDLTNDPLAWVLLSDEPGFLDVDSVTGELSGTPDDSDVGDWLVSVELNDGVGGVTRADLTLRVINVNDGPTVSSLPEWTPMEEEKEHLNLSSFISDVDDPIDALILSCGLQDIIVDGLVISAEYEEWVPKHVLNLNVSDGKAVVWFNLTVNVINVNDPPVVADVRLNSQPFNPLSDTLYLRQGSGDVLRVNATDEDGDEVQYRWVHDGKVVASGNELRYGDLEKGYYENLTLEISDGEATVEYRIFRTYVVLDDETGWVLYSWVLPLIIVSVTVALAFFLVRRNRNKNPEG